MSQNENRFYPSILLVFCSLLASPSFAIDSAPAGGSGGPFDQGRKIQAKESSRWTLQEWLAQKQRNYMMDLWLGMYAPSPYEFFLEGSASSYTKSYLPYTSVDENHRSNQGGLGAYATVVGIEGYYEHNIEENYTDLTGTLNLRLLGNAVQGTHLNVYYGMRTRTKNVAGTDIRVGTPTGGADLNVYLTRYFGISGRYSQYLPADDVVLGTVSGYKSEAGVFIDFKSFRVFGSWYYDRQDQKKTQVESAEVRSGFKSGLKIFF